MWNLYYFLRALYFLHIFHTIFHKTKMRFHGVCMEAHSIATVIKKNYACEGFSRFWVLNVEYTNCNLWEWDKETTSMFRRERMQKIQVEIQKWSDMPLVFYINDWNWFSRMFRMISVSSSCRNNNCNKVFCLLQIKMQFTGKT